jgi:peptide deformylase
MYREHPLTWDELQMYAQCGDDPMLWRVKQDRDAFKELWLLFENEHGHFPLYPGQSVSIEYGYSVGEDKWGTWFQRAVRVPTKRLSVQLLFPTELAPSVWGMETTMTAEAQPFRTAINREQRDGVTAFSWATEDPRLHARYRLEWNFRNQQPPESVADESLPSERMASIGIEQVGSPILREKATAFELPAEAEDARRVVSELYSAIERAAAIHHFAKGLGVAAPQIGIGRAAAVVRTANGELITLINPQIVEESAETDDQYEGCWSFFDVRGKLARPLAIHVEHQDVDGRTQITSFELGVARLVAHEIDHLNGVLYTDRMTAGVEPIPVSDYRGTGESWTHSGRKPR